MEKTKNIPGWYQRLISHPTKPASQVTFKQYCRDHETKMRILYTFLPQEQVRGKLFARWKRHQPQYQDTYVKGGTKKINKPKKFPLVTFSKGTTPWATLEKKSENRFDWLNETNAPVVASKMERTYKGRAFVLPPKVPTIISETPNPERSILKNKSTGANTPREKRQPASQVSFTLKDPECPSPQLYSPPTPFVLSPMSDDDQKAEIFPQKQISLTSVSRKLAAASTNKSAGEKNNKTKHEKPAGKENVIEQYQVQKRSNQVQSSVQLEESLKDISDRKPKGKRAKKEKVPKNKGNDVTPIENSQLSFQFLEPPKFSTVLCETEDEKEKRFCIFEDEWIKPKTSSKKAKPKQRKSKSPKEKREQLFSWSPSVLGCSQYTPKVNKSRKDLFPTENETYHKQKQSHAKQLPGKPQDKQRKKQASSGRKTTSQISAKSASPKHSENNQKQAKDVPSKRNVKLSAKIHKTQSGQISFIDLHPAEGSMPADGSMLEEKENIGYSVSLPQAKTSKRGKQSKNYNTDFKENQQAFGHGKPSRSDSKTVSRKPLTTVSGISESRNQKGEASKNRAKPKYENYEKNKLKENTPVTERQPQREKQVFYGNADEGLDCSVSSPNFATPMNSKPESPVSLQQTPDGPLHGSPGQQPQGSDLLRRILFQLRDTTSTNGNVGQSSPAQSRITEASGVSMKCLSSNGQSPASTRDITDLVDDLQSNENVSSKKAPTMVSSGGTAYRKRGNILCNMFDASDSDIAVPAKKRYLPSESQGLSESDFSILFSADIFV